MKRERGRSRVGAMLYTWMNNDLEALPFLNLFTFKNKGADLLGTVSAKVSDLLIFFFFYPTMVWFQLAGALTKRGAVVVPEHGSKGVARYLDVAGDVQVHDEFTSPWLTTWVLTSHFRFWEFEVGVLLHLYSNSPNLLLFSFFNLILLQAKSREDLYFMSIVQIWMLSALEKL